METPLFVCVFPPQTSMHCMCCASLSGIKKLRPYLFTKQLDACSERMSRTEPLRPPQRPHFRRERLCQLDAPLSHFREFIVILIAPFHRARERLRVFSARQQPIVERP